MSSRRGTIFFWIVQALLAPAWVCFVATLTLRFAGPHPAAAKVGLAAGLVQVPLTGVALIFVLAAGMGKLLNRNSLFFLYLETFVSLVLITFVFVWRGVYGA
ncbi:MAG: hypothetical protein ACM3JB_23380 [Acidobacteriaceae bacterium]